MNNNNRYQTFEPQYKIYILNKQNLNIILLLEYYVSF